MKAIVSTKYGTPDILTLQEVAKPRPKENEVLIRVHAASVNAADVVLLSGKPFLVRLMGFGLFRPKHSILGVAIAGRIETVGANVKNFKPGDDVLGDLTNTGRGGFAEYVCANAEALALKPAGVTYEDAAAIPLAAVTALQGLRDRGQIRAGQKVLINGASGGVGTFAVQIAKSYGAEVTAVCSTGNVDAARRIGADHVIDYTMEDFTKNGQHYDLILAANGDTSVYDYKKSLSPAGIFVMIGGSEKQVFQSMLLGPLVFMSGTKRMGKFSPAKPSAKDLTFLNSLLESDKLKPVIDKRFSLAEGVAAIQYLARGHAKGKVLINMDSI